jgi:hypothetical protein
MYTKLRKLQTVDGVYRFQTQVRDVRQVSSRHNYLTNNATGLTSIN